VDCSTNRIRRYADDFNTDIVDFNSIQNVDVCQCFSVLYRPVEVHILQWVVPPPFIALMMEAVRISEMSVYFNETTRCNTPDGYNFHENSFMHSRVITLPEL
jgi:hypothetical protein